MLLLQHLTDTDRDTIRHNQTLSQTEQSAVLLLQHLTDTYITCYNSCHSNDNAMS